MAEVAVKGERMGSIFHFPDCQTFGWTLLVLVFLFHCSIAQQLSPPSIAGNLRVFSHLFLSSASTSTSTSMLTMTCKITNVLSIGVQMSPLDTLRRTWKTRAAQQSLRLSLLRSFYMSSRQ